MTRPRALVLAEIAVVTGVLAAAVSLLLVTASAVPGQGPPATPAAPARPPSPPAPAAPAAPEGTPVGQLSLALLEVSIGAHRSREVEVELAAALRRLGTGREVAPLAGALADGLRGRSLQRAVRGRVAVAVAAALAAAPGGDLEAALGEVRAALAAAGLGAPEVVVVEDGLRRASGGRR